MLFDLALNFRFCPVGAHLLFANAKYFLRETSLRILPRQLRSALLTYGASFDLDDCRAPDLPENVYYF